MEQDNNTHIVIMAGGIGSRFWPMPPAMMTTCVFNVFPILFVAYLALPVEDRKDERNRCCCNPEP